MVLFPLGNLVKSQIVIQDSVFTTTFDMLGSSWDNAIIKNCTFKNTILSDGLRIANANNVTIDSCTFYNIQGNGIRLHPIGVSEGVIIKNCRFDSIYGNGILADEQHRNTQILNNTFNWIGLDTTSTLQGAPHHGIYFTGSNYLISGNHIHHVFNNNGCCVSVRSNGIVRNNVLSNALKNGISYYSDHPNVENRLLVENNIVYNCQRGMNIADGGEPYVDSTVIRFNTFITEDYMNVSIGSGLSMNIDIYGNVLIRKDGSTVYLWGDSPFNSSTNVVSSGDIGFVDFLNHDYHITNLSTAFSFANGLTDFPTQDFENDTRDFSRLDAGADQFKTISGFQNQEFNDVLFYPNPANTEIYFVLTTSENAQIEIYNLLGTCVLVEKNKNNVQISNLPNGIYVIFIKQGQRTYCQKLVKQ